MKRIIIPSLSAQVEVERALKERNLLSDASEDETATETGGETSEYEASPVKRPRTSNFVSVFV